ncbi:MAG: sugar transferase [Bdellovibrionota bacterium]
MELICVSAAIRQSGFFTRLIFKEARYRRLLFIAREKNLVRIAEALSACDADFEFLPLSEATPKMIRRFRPAHLVLEPGLPANPKIARVLCEAHLAGTKIQALEKVLMDLDYSVPVESEELIERMTAGRTHQSWGTRAYTAIKNVFEPVLAFVMLIPLSPILLAVAAAIKLTSPGPVFYRQTRLGYLNRPFDLIKFRSMRNDAEKDGPVWASASTSDSRLSPIGAFLRATHLDELPQLLNVIRGELSFIGPRPERPVFAEQLCEKIPLFGLRTLVKPGMSGWAQVRQGYANSIDDSKRKLELDLYYVLRQSASLDFKVILETLSVVTSVTQRRDFWEIS